MTSLSRSLQTLPFIAILRGIETNESERFGTILYELGFRAIEVPLNSPNAIQSIALLRRTLPSDCLVGAGTVLSLLQLNQVIATGANLCVMPNCNPQVIQHAVKANMQVIPGVATISEALVAIEAGATALKLFPSESVPPSVLKAWKSVLPDITCIPTGGIGPEHLSSYWQAGARGFGLGSQLYSAKMPQSELIKRATNYTQEALGLLPKT